MITGVTQEDFVEKLCEREVLPTVEVIIEKLRHYRGAYVHSASFARSYLESLVESLRAGEIMLRTFTELKKELPYPDELFRRLYDTFVRGTYTL